VGQWLSPPRQLSAIRHDCSFPWPLSSGVEAADHSFCMNHYYLPWPRKCCRVFVVISS
jgi:hypothetical protein